MKRKEILTERLALNFEDLSKKWKENRDSMRKITVGKNGFKRIDINSYLKNNGNNNICNHRFNFVKQINRCISCSEICFISEDGEPEKEEITIDGLVLLTQKLELPKNECFINFKTVDFTNFLELIPKLSEFKTNREYTYLLEFFNCKKFRYVALCCVMEWCKINNPLFAAYLCDNFVIVNSFPANVIDEFYPEDCISVLKILAKYSEKIIHGRESLNYLNIYRKGNKLEVQMIPCNYTAIEVKGYNNKNIFIPSKNYNPNYNSRFYADVVIGERPENHKVNCDFPMMEEYKYMSVFVVRMTQELFDYYENTSFNVFPPFRFYIWIIVLLSNSNFFKSMNLELLKLLFFESELNMILDRVKRNHETEVTYEHVKQFCIETNFAMKFEALDLVSDFNIPDSF